MNIDTVTADIESWIKNFVEVPHPALGGFPPCPYARSARLKKKYQIILGLDPYYDLKNRSRWGMFDQEVIIYAYSVDQWSLQQFCVSVESANQEFLLRRDLVALDDHPHNVENVNGVIMNQGNYALALVQSLSDLNAKAKIMAKQGFYQTWPEQYLQSLFQHRQDPRQ